MFQSSTVFFLDTRRVVVFRRFLRNSLRNLRRAARRSRFSASRVFPRIAHKPGRRHSVALSLPRERPFDAEWCKMVLKTEVCRFSGLKIYPGHGMRLTKMDSQTYLFLNAKCKRLFNLRLRPAKLAWTTQYRKAHKKVRTRRTTRLCRVRCARSRDVDVAPRVDARRRTARPLGKSHRTSRFRVFRDIRSGTGLG
jgi:large subunit ribosomal protein L24e